MSDLWRDNDWLIYLFYFFLFLFRECLIFIYLYYFYIGHLLLYLLCGPELCNIVKKTCINKMNYIIVMMEETFSTFIYFK